MCVISFLIPLVAPPTKSVQRVFKLTFLRQTLNFRTELPLTSSRFILTQREPSSKEKGLSNFYYEQKDPKAAYFKEN